MKKTVFCVLICVVATALLSSCSSSGESINSYTDDNGNYVIESDGRTSVRWGALPASLNYNGKEIVVAGVSFYEDMGSDYSHTLFAVVELDLSNLEDGEIHWLRESDLDVDIYLTHEQNEYDFDRMFSLGNLFIEDGRRYLLVRTSSFFEENRYSFAQGEAHVVVSARQEETYEYVNDEGETSDLHKTFEVTHNATIAAEIPTSSEIEPLLQEYIAKWLYGEAAQTNPN